MDLDDGLTQFYASSSELSPQTYGFLEAEVWGCWWWRSRPQQPQKPLSHGLKAWVCLGFQTL